MKNSLLSITLIFLLLCSCQQGQHNNSENTLSIKDSITKTKPTPTTITFSVKVGERIRSFADRLEKDSLTTAEAIIQMANQKFVFNHPILPAPNDSITRFEGMFKPGTYRIAACKLHPKDSVNNQQKALSNASVIIETLLKESAAHFTSLDESNGLTPYQKVVLASIVEKEAVKNQCYDSITSVFYNRIKRNYPLASCITVEYVLGYHRSFLTNDDIKTESPYNLYTNTGLTPTPVCFVSPEALVAAQNPITTNLRYFVYDWTDHTISFATTASVHDTNSVAARNNFIKKFGKKNLRKKYYGNFYEPIDSIAN